MCKSFLFLVTFFVTGFIFSQDRCTQCANLYEEKKFEEIIKIVKPLGEKASVNDLVFLGRSYQSIGDTKNAIKAYETLLLIDDQNVDACVAVSALFIDMESYENAKFAADRALKFDKKNTKALYNIGVIYYQTKEYQKFEEHMRQNLQNEGARADFLYLKAACLLDQEKFEESLITFKELESVNPNHEDLAFYQGYCLFKTEKFQEAKEKFTAASQLKNDMMIEVYYYLAHTNIKLENKVDACDAYNNAINLGDVTLIKEADDYCIEKRKKNFKLNTRTVRVKL